MHETKAQKYKRNEKQGSGYGALLFIAENAVLGVCGSTPSGQNETFSDPLHTFTFPELNAEVLADARNSLNNGCFAVSNYGNPTFFSDLDLSFIIDRLHRSFLHLR